MRVLVISDIHGNWEALRAVAHEETSRVDRIVCLGDLVDYGPRPGEVVSWVREHATATIRGNHDNAVGYGVACRSAQSFRRMSEETRRLTIPRLPEDERRYLSELPLRQQLQVDGLKVELIHAAPRDPLFEYLPATDAQGWAAAMASVTADILLVGHTHLQAILPVGRQLVVNPGSVGLSRDGDARAAYAVLEDGRPVLKRVAYDVERTLRDLRAWRLPPDVERNLAQLFVGGAPSPVASGVQA